MILWPEHPISLFTFGDWGSDSGDANAESFAWEQPPMDGTTVPWVTLHSTPEMDMPMTPRGVILVDRALRSWGGGIRDLSVGLSLPVLVSISRRSKTFSTRT